MSVGDWFLGSGPDRGQSPVEWGEIPFVRLSVRPSVPSSGWPSNPTGWPSDPEGQLEGSEGLLEGSEGLLEGSEGWLEGSEGQLEGSEGQPAGSEGQPAGSEGQPEGGRTDGRTDVRTEFLPILQDFVPCRGRCPKIRKKLCLPQTRVPQRSVHDPVQVSRSVFLMRSALIPSPMEKQDSESPTTLLDSESPTM